MLTIAKERGWNRRKRETGAPRRHKIATVSKFDIQKKRSRPSPGKDKKQVPELPKKNKG